ncbi:MAG: Chemotaxis response regulator protein-glutamate methylesterase CheB [Micavibrio sp.]|nr:Chemotaxis response regulator protein-glutamate methylesterase CheB [Micavibrio sp.]
MSERKKISILIVDDSAVIRAIISKTLEQHADIHVIGTANNGQEAIEVVARARPDVVILDIEMPVMDGMTALPLILKEKPDALVLMCSTLSSRGADISIRAMALGAADCLLKPGGESITTAIDFQRNLLRTILTLWQNLHAPQTAQMPVPQRPATPAAPPRVLAIGSSTGGPKALTDLLKDLRNLPVPIVITQHMPKSFTALLAQNLQQSCGLTCMEGGDGMILKAGCVYIAPGGLHMTFRQNVHDTVIKLDNGTPENFCKPSVNPMLRSLNNIYGGRVQVAILTGMGSDGLEGCRQIVESGGQVIAQDKASSVVWGMPHAVAMAGLCAAVLPLTQMAPWLRQSITGRKVA